MTTAEALEGITDAGSFEILCIRALRSLYTDCEGIEHLGVNAQGKTIPGPIDGFCRIPGSPAPKYISAAFTIAAREELKRKWYTDPGTRYATGDLMKACSKAEEVRKIEPESTFCVYLCTNRRLDHEFMTEGYALGRRHGVEVVFVGQSLLRDFLDEARGQPLREEFLGIKATRISRELLLKLCRTNLANYYVNDFSQMLFVETSDWRKGQSALQASAPLLAIVGMPGSGKTVLARSLLQRHADNGGVGLWIPGDFLQEAASLQDAVTLTLRQIVPYLGQEVGFETLALGEAQHPLLLILDDPNRTDRPGVILKKIFGWGRSFWSEDDSERGRVKLIVPVWETQFSYLHDKHEGEKWLSVLSMGPMQPRESLQCLKNGLRGQSRSLSDNELVDVADRLHHDPILLSMFARLVRLEDDFRSVLDDVIGAFIDRSLADLALIAPRTKVAYRTALTQLTADMIRRRRLHPEWQEVRAWLAPDIVQVLEELVSRGEICHVASQGRRNVFEFRHDRILEWQVSDAIIGLLMDRPSDWDALVDPYMVPMLGRSLATESAPKAILDLAPIPASP